MKTNEAKLHVVPPAPESAPPRGRRARKDRNSGEHPIPALVDDRVRARVLAADKPAAGPASKAPKGFMTDLRALASRDRLLEVIVGAFYAGVVPVAVFVTTHVAIPKLIEVAHTHGDPTGEWAFIVFLGVIAAGGLLKSAPAVYEVSVEAFRRKKHEALGFTVLAEGVMTFVPVLPLQLFMLVLLTAINAVGCATGFSKPLPAAKPASPF